MSRLLPLLLLLSLTACDSGVDSPPVGASTIQVVGDAELDLRGEGFYSRTGDQPPTWEIVLTGQGNTPTVRFRIVTDAVGTGIFALPRDANARLDLADDDATTYTAIDGSLVITDVTPGRAVGRYAFTGERPSGQRVTVSGTFTAE